MVSRQIVIPFVLCIVCGTISGEKKACKTAEGKEVKIGRQYDVPGYCLGNICKGDGKFSITTCGLISIPFGWTVTPEDPGKGFPDCCSKPLPPLDIVPDVLDNLQFGEWWEISFGDNVTVDFENELTPTQVKDEPTINYSFWVNPEAFYLLALVDPDVPSRQNPDFRAFLHWLVGNIPGDDVQSGEVLAEYVGSGPSKGTGLHRYVFLLYKQPGKLKFDEAKINKNTAQGRWKFSAKKFAEKYTLGFPVAINAFEAQYDDYVPQIHNQLNLHNINSGNLQQKD